MYLLVVFIFFGTMVNNVANVHDLSQIASAPTHGNTLIFGFFYLRTLRGDVINIPAITSSDHNGQLIKLPVWEGYITLKCIN